MLIDFEWLNEDGVKGVISFVYNIISVIRIIVPIALVVMTSFDIAKKVIDPSEKEGQQKIMRRALAALIVFFIPTFVDLFLKIADIDIKKLDHDDSSYVIVSDDNTGDFNIISCPGATTQYNNSSFTLNTNISSSYEGDILWSITRGNNVVSLNPSSDKRSATVKVSNVSSKGSAIITVTAGGKNRTCTINYDLEGLSNLDIVNCSSNTYHNNDIVLLQSNIPSSYTGEIYWSITQGKNIAKLVPTNGNRDANISLSNIISDGQVKVVLSAGKNSVTCPINYEVKKLSSVSITNCPNNASLYNVGDKFTLTTDIPADHTGIEWSTDETSSVKLTPSADKRSVTVNINSKPNKNYFIVTTKVDGITSQCLVNMKNDQLTDMKITNCPNSSYVLHNRDSVNLNTSVPSDYTGIINWKVILGSDVVNINPSSDRRSANISFNNIKNKGTAVIQIEASGKTNVCSINYDIEKVQSVAYTNCPSSSKLYSVGESFELTTDIPSNNAEAITWTVSNANIASVNPSLDKRKATIRINNTSTNNSFVVKTKVGTVETSCTIYLKNSELSDVRITNCPTNMYYNQGSVTLNSNIPTTFTGDITWKVLSGSSVATITPSYNNRSATVRFSNIRIGGAAIIQLTAGSKTSTCSISYGIRQTASPTPRPTAIPTSRPTTSPTSRPTASPTPRPTASPTPKPTASPTPKPCNAPTNVSISKTGVVSWNGTASKYKVCINGSLCETTTSKSINYYSQLTNSAGIRRVTVKSICDNRESTEVTSTINTYSITVLKGDVGITDVSLTNGKNTTNGKKAVFISGESVTIDATVNTSIGYNWDKWSNPNNASMNCDTFVGKKCNIIVSKDATFTASTKKQQLVTLSVGTGTRVVIDIGWSGVIGTLRVMHVQSQKNIEGIRYCVSGKGQSDCAIDDLVQPKNYISRSMDHTYNNSRLCTNGDDNGLYRLDKKAPNGGIRFPNDQEAYVPFCFENSHAIRIRVYYMYNGKSTYEEFGPYTFNS